MKYLLDTNVVSEFRLSSPNPGVVAWWAGVDQDSLYLSVITLGEIRKGIERKRARDPELASALDVFLDGLTHAFARRIEMVDVEIADIWGRLRAAPGTPPIDGLLAATALARGWTFVTRNVRDVEQTGCLVLNPFT